MTTTINNVYALSHIKPEAINKRQVINGHLVVRFDRDGARSHPAGLLICSPVFNGEMWGHADRGLFFPDMGDEELLDLLALAVAHDECWGGDLQVFHHNNATEYIANALDQASHDHWEDYCLKATSIEILIAGVELLANPYKPRKVEIDGREVFTLPPATPAEPAPVAPDFAQIASAADEAFWAVVAKALPQCPTGDYCGDFELVALREIKTWYADNVEHSAADIEKLARLFAKKVLSHVDKLSAFIEDSEWNIQRSNCSSHDICDSNIEMFDAMVELGFCETETEFAPRKLWGAAWDLAKERHWFQMPRDEFVRTRRQVSELTDVVDGYLDPAGPGYTYVNDRFHIHEHEAGKRYSVVMCNEQPFFDSLEDAERALWDFAMYQGCLDQ